MVDLDRLANKARDAAESSRIRMACRTVVAVTSFCAIAIAAGGSVVPCLCLAFALFAGTALLRWWHREGVEAVRLGLVMGAVPMLAGVVLPGCGVNCAPPGQFGEAELICVLAGIVAGAGLAVFAERKRGQWRVWFLATLVAGLTASLGCTTLGVTGLAATLLAMTVSSVAVRIPLLLRAS